MRNVRGYAFRAPELHLKDQLSALNRNKDITRYANANTNELPYPHAGCRRLKATGAIHAEAQEARLGR